jgi:MarR family transcriptional regulator, organic hydroperoxide resistance regulator
MTTPTTPATALPAPSSMAASDSILHHLSHAFHEITAAFERHMGMSRARWAVLSRLYREGSLTQATLSRVLHVDAAAITRQVKQLEVEGLVKRWAAPEDNRFTVVELTGVGRAFVESQRARRDDFERIVTAGLSVEDIDHMRHCLLHMRRNLAELEREG